MFKSWPEVEQYEKDEKRKDDGLKYQNMQYVHEIFKHYRQSGIALSAIFISISSALIAWFVNILSSGTYDPKILSIIELQLVLLALIIFSSILMQYFHYQGYKHLARSYFEQSGKNLSDKFFARQDGMVNFSGILFIVQLFFLIFYFIKYFQ